MTIRAWRGPDALDRGAEDQQGKGLPTKDRPILYEGCAFVDVRLGFCEPLKQRPVYNKGLSLKTLCG